VKRRLEKPYNRLFLREAEEKLDDFFAKENKVGEKIFRQASRGGL